MNVALLILAFSTRGAEPGNDFFERQVRPLLVEHCHSCHGPKKQNAGLRLDSRAAVLQGGDNGPVVELRHPEKSPLIDAIHHRGVKMPPKGKLSKPAIDAFETWVRLGLPWPEAKAGDKTVSLPSAEKHWAFRPVQKPPGEKLSIDRFILSSLKSKGLSFASPADRRTLLRRASFGLLGLPPTPEEIEAFEKDEAPDAWERVVDRLLASPHYGERWARHWLDIARYADTKGYVFFEEHDYPWAYAYRDYVIRAFNEDLPYDRFLVEQLAADLMPLGEDRRPLRALGFLTLGNRFMNNPHDVLDDRIDVVTRGLLGLTVSCARCHDHKFDPIPTRDYYSLYGVFASSVEAPVPPLFEPPPATDAYRKFDEEMKARERKLTDFVRAKHDELMTSARRRFGEYLLAAHDLRDKPATDDFMLLTDANDLNPNMIQRYKNFLDRRSKTFDPVLGPWLELAAAPEKSVPELAAKLRRDERVSPRIVELLSPLPISRQVLAKRYQKLFDELDGEWRETGRVVREDEAALYAVFYGPDAPANVQLLPHGDLTLLPDRPAQNKLRELRKAVEEWRSKGDGAPPRAHALEELPDPVEPVVFRRGNPHQPGEVVPRQMPQIVAPLRQPFQKGSGRLELARAIASRDNPLTARVFVNRVWQQHFGKGLVATSSDFGLRSDPPSHPELLDYLADSFLENGWSIKKLHREILMSDAYRQASDDRPAAFAIDPENRLLWRGSRTRLDFESTRDSLLFVSGQLDARIGGPSVKDAFTTGKRRTLYSYLDRLNVPGLFRTFDFPTPDATSPERSLTTVPPQALFLMNHPFVANAAKQTLVRPEIAKSKEATAKIERLHGVLFGRRPSTEELRLGQAFVGSNVWERYVHALMLTNEFAVVD